MENGEAVLEEGKVDLTLDRPPPHHPPSSVDDGDDLLNRDTVNVTIGNKDHHSKFSNCFIEKPVKVQGEKPKSKSESELENQVGLRLDLNADDINMGNRKYVNIQDPTTIMVVSSESHDDLPKIQKKGQNMKTRKRHNNLTSCLKSSQQEGKIINKEKGKQLVHFNDGLNIVAEYIDPVDPWRDG